MEEPRGRKVERERPEPTRERAYSYALWLLGRRDYSRSKLERKLVEKGYEAFATSVLDELVEKEYLRESAYAESRVRGWIRKGFSESMILRRARMERFEITPERVRDLYAEMGIDETKQVRTLLKKRLRRGPVAGDDRHGRRKLAASAARKGHSFATINVAIESELAGDLDEEPSSLEE
jgi:SOS response regulatory protein OraA/RecX